MVPPIADGDLGHRNQAEGRAMVNQREDRVYRFDPVDMSGVFLGLGLVQCALIGGGLVLSVVAVTQDMPLPLAAVPVVAGAAASFGRLGGYAAWEWLPMV